MIIYTCYAMLAKEPFFETIPIRDPNDRKSRTTLRVPMLLPHLLVEYLVTQNLVEVSGEAMRTYWQHMVDNQVSWALAHPGKFSHYPIGIYGDEGQINKAGDKCVVVTLNLLLDSRGDGFLHRFPIFTLREWCSLGMESMHSLTQIMAWSFNVPWTEVMSYGPCSILLHVLSRSEALYEGRHPDVDYLGRDTLPKGMKHRAGQPLPGTTALMQQQQLNQHQQQACPV